MNLLRFLLSCCTALALSCGYFNSMYNAQRRFGDAERATRQGNETEAARAYAESIEKAAASYRGHPRGRWADDALFLIGRARFALHEYEAARAAFQTLLDMQPSPDIRTGALAWLGAAEVSMSNHAQAEGLLSQAIENGDAGGELRAFAQLWRARARFHNGRIAEAWSDLDALAQAGSAERTLAALEAVGRGIDLGDSARVRSAMARLGAARDGARWSDSLALLARNAHARFGPLFTGSALGALEQGSWPAAARETHVLARIQLLAEAGDTLNAVLQATRLAERSSSLAAGPVRVSAARLQLATVDSVPQLVRVRALLLPVLDHADARALVRSMKVMDVLLERAQAGQPLALFAAAELARDELHAARLARQLFLAYAEIVPDAVWAPKALLAASALTSSASELEAITGRFHSHQDNVYVRALAGAADDDGMYATAEERLARNLIAIREDALVAADARDVRVGSAVARLDSLKARATADSLKLQCGELIDSLAISGIREDSVRAACLRSDPQRIALLLKIDTLLLRDSTRVDTLTGRRRRNVRDTTSSRLW